MEPEPDEDEEIDPADLAPCISGNTPIITIPASEDEEVAGEVTADGAEEVIQGLEELTQEIKDKTSLPCADASSEQHTVVPNVDIWIYVYSIKGRVYFLKRKKEKRELNKKKNCSFIIENNLILSDFAKIFKLPHIYIFFLNCNFCNIVGRETI